MVWLGPEGGREGAPTALRRFWPGVGQAAPFSAVPHGPWGDWLGPNNPWLAPMHAWTGWLGQQVSPDQSNPLNLNPLRDILLQTVDCERVRRCDKTGLFIAATQVSNGALRIFRQDEMTVDMVLASACLPLVFQAMEIDGQAYWDGGYAGNPSLLPLVVDSAADDLLLVQINPAQREATPTRARDILDRINQVTFNASLVKELRNIALLQALLKHDGQPREAAGRGLFDRVGRLRVHRLDAGADLAALVAGSKKPAPGIPGRNAAPGLRRSRSLAAPARRRPGPAQQHRPGAGGLAMMGIAGIVSSLVLLIFLANRSISVLLLAPAMALLAVLFSPEAPRLASYTQVFMTALAGFVALYLPQFLLSALFSLYHH